MSKTQVFPLRVWNKIFAIVSDFQEKVGAHHVSERIRVGTDFYTVGYADGMIRVRVDVDEEQYTALERKMSFIRGDMAQIQTNVPAHLVGTSKHEMHKSLAEAGREKLEQLKAELEIVVAKIAAKPEAKVYSYGITDFPSSFSVELVTEVIECPPIATSPTLEPTSTESLESEQPPTESPKEETPIVKSSPAKSKSKSR